MSPDPGPERPGTGGATHPADDSPGTTSSPQSPPGGGPDLAAPGAAARTSPAGPTPDTNQAKAEPVPPQGGQSVTGTTGTGDPQGARLPRSAAGSTGPSGAAGGPAPDPGAPGRRPDADLEVDTDSSASVGDPAPRSDEPGEALRTRGSLGASPSPFAADTERGAAATAPGSPPGSAAPADATPGDAAGVSVNDTSPMPGTTEESDVVQGVRPTVPAGGGFQAASPSGQQVSGAHRPAAPDGEVASD